jgi:hypothetical protein
MFDESKVSYRVERREYEDTKTKKLFNGDFMVASYDFEDDIGKGVVTSDTMLMGEEGILEASTRLRHEVWSLYEREMTLRPLEVIEGALMQTIEQQIRSRLEAILEEFDVGLEASFDLRYVSLVRDVPKKVKPVFDSSSKNMTWHRREAVHKRTHLSYF